MSNFCKNCGAELQDEMLNCPICGAEVNADVPEETVSAEPVETSAAEMPIQSPKAPKAAKKVKWWMVAIPAVLVIAIVAALAWQPLLGLLAPGKALESAQENTNEKLNDRYEGSPFAVLMKGAMWIENGEMALDVGVNANGQQMSANMLLQSNRPSKQMGANLAVEYGDLNISGSVYGDPDKIAIAVDQFNDGTYYGVTLDTFKEDLKASVLGSAVTDEQIEMIDRYLQMVREMISSEEDYSKLLEPYAAIVKEYMDKLEMTKGEGEIKLDGEYYNCTTMTLTMDEEYLFEMLEKLLDQLEEDEDIRELFESYVSKISSIVAFDSAPSNVATGIMDLDDIVKQLRDALDEAQDMLKLDMEMTYYQYKGYVVAYVLKADLEVDEEEISAEFKVNYGLNPGVSDIIVSVVMESDGETFSMELVSKVEKSGDTYKETIEVELEVPDTEKVKEQIVIEWNRKSGDLSYDFQMNIPGSEEIAFTFECKLEELDNGFRLSVEDFEIEGVVLDVKLTCTTGTELKAPEFVNLDKWDENLMNEFMTWVSGFIPEGPEVG